jgi:hypothetical protein
VDYQDLWPLIQQDILGCLLADAIIGARVGVAVEPGDIEDALNRKVQMAIGPGLDGRMGIGFLVLPIEEASDENANMPGGPLKLTILVQFVENVSLNRGPRGTMLPCRVWTALAEKLLKLYTPVGLTQSLVPSQPTIYEFTPDRDTNLRVGQLKFTASEADFRPFLRVARPQIVVSGSVVAAITPNSYQLTGTATVLVKATADSVWYTVDGSHPREGNAQATLYTGAPVNITQPCLFRARAFTRNQSGSDTAAANFWN